MRKISTLLSLLIISIVVYAVPAKPGLWKTIKLSNGTEVRAQLVGDEFGHFWQGADGQTYVKLPNTDYYSIADVEAIKAKAQTRRQEANARRMLRSPRDVVNNRRASSTVHKALILLVNFKDETFDSTHDNDLFLRIANEEGFNEGDFKGSMKDYFKAQSLGQFILEFDVIGPLTVSQNRSYYGENGPGSDDGDKHPAEMVIEAVNMAKELITDWTPYDWDGDKYVDQVYVVYAGKGEADGGSDDTIWPHAWDLSSASYYGDGDGPVTVANNLKVNTYACGSELNGSGKICGIGTMCHEFSHCLGYPDFYDTDYSGGQGMGYWDLMDSGSYNGNGYQPAGYTSYERWTASWITPTVLEEENVTIEKMKALQETGESYVIYNKGHRDEFFLLENRQPIGWDASLPGKGLLILHCDYDEDVWAQNKPNDNTSRQRMTWIPADNKYQYTTYQGSKYYSFDGMKNDPFPYGSVNSFSKNTTPAAEFYNKNSDGTYYMDSSVEDITQNNDGTVSFKFVANSTIVTPTDDYLFYESFNKCNGTGGNNGKWSGNNTANATFLPDYNGWVTSNAYGAYQCAKFGTASNNGTATTPAFIVDRSATLTFNAGAWDGKNDGTTLKLSVSKGSIYPESITMTKGAWGTYTAIITATDNVKVTFAAEKGRFFLDEVLIVESDTELSATVVTAPTAKTLTYTGSAQELVDAGVASGGTMQYSLDGTTYDTKIPTGTNAGSYTVYYKVVGDASHSDTPPATVSVTIKKAPLTISGGTYTMKQGEELPEFVANYTGFKNDETEEVLTTKPTLTTTATSASEPGEYEVTVSGAEAANYEITYEAGTLTIVEVEADAVTLTAQSYTITYGDALPEFGYTSEGAALDGTPAITCEATSASSVGTYPIIIAQGTVTNGNVTYVNGTLTIEKAPLTISGGTYTMKQGEELPEFVANYTGFKNDETEEVLTTKPTLTTTATSASEPGEYEVTVSGAEAANYEITYEAGTLTIVEADAVTLTAQSYTITYGDVLPEFDFTSEGAAVDGTPSITCEATSASPVGTYPIVITKGSVTNYNDHYVNGTLTIEKAPLTISGGTYTMKQGEELPAFTASYTGFKNGETEDVLITKPTLTTEATSSSEPGEYEVTVSGAEAQNYAITYEAGTLTIVEADAVTLTAQSYTITYGDVLPEFDFTSEGAAVDGTPSITCEATSASPVGTYPIVITKGSVTNYNDHYVNGTLTIEKAPLTISGGTYTMKQGEELPAFTANYTGFKNDETEDVLITKPTLTTEATSSSEPGEYEVTVSGAEAQNYTITYEAGTLTITEASGICAPLNDNGEMINDNWYTIDGRKLQSKPTQKGVYIQNGTKVVIK